MKDFFTPTESAEHFGVCEKMIARRLWAKGIPARKVGRAWRISRRILFG
ncbi:MAG: helix-turn-helix domain-containing protein [Thermodesulfobacteriota bacterium]